MPLIARVDRIRKLHPQVKHEIRQGIKELSTGILYSLNSQASDPIASEPIELSIASTMMSLASILSLSARVAMSMKN